MGSHNSHTSDTSREMENEDNQTISSTDEESDQEYEGYGHSSILQGLIDSGEVHIMASNFSDIFEVERPKTWIKHTPNTSLLDKSEFSTITKLSSGDAYKQNYHVANNLKRTNITSFLASREIGTGSQASFSYPQKCKIFNRYLPNHAQKLDSYGGKAFCGLFSKDGNTFLTASQDRKIRIYNSSNSAYKEMKCIRARDVGWSIIDVAFNSSQNLFVYSTWSSTLHLSSVNDENDHQEPLCLINTGRRFCIFSVVFSSDGRELLGGANDGCLYTYDLQTQKRKEKIPAHDYDVNTVAFADDSSNIIYSGGDDGLIKVWDRRALSDSLPKPVGVLAGHYDGITFIDSRGDGRHLISNSKDQSIKLWDIRVFSGEDAAQKSLQAVLDQTWDYRWQEVPQYLYKAKPKIEGDTSIMTYRGHIVVKTLIRCRFSPVETTGQRYIYTGCGSGRVVVYDALTGKIQHPCKVQHNACVRDVSWHPKRNEIVSSSWDGQIKLWTYRDVDPDFEKPKNEIEDIKNKKIRRSRRLASRNQQINAQ